MTTLDRARAAVMEQLGWEDDRQAEHFAGSAWDTATDVAQAVMDVVEADRVPADTDLPGMWEQADVTGGQTDTA